SRGEPSASWHCFTWNFTPSEEPCFTWNRVSYKTHRAKITEAWQRSSRLRTKKVGSVRPQQPSTSAPRLPPQGCEFCWSTLIPKETQHPVSESIRVQRNSPSTTHSWVECRFGTRH